MKRLLLLSFLFFFAFNVEAQNENNNYFTLKKDVRLDKEVANGYGGKMIFDKDSFMLLLDVLDLNPRRKSLKVTYSVVRLSDTVTVYNNVYSFVIKKSGRITTQLRNAKKYNAYKAQKKSLESTIEQLKKEIDDLSPESEEDELLQLSISLESAYSEYYTLKEVFPKYKTVDPYNDIIGVYIDNGILTEEGIIWAKSLPFLKGNLSKYINTK